MGGKPSAKLGEEVNVEDHQAPPAMDAWEVLEHAKRRNGDRLAVVDDSVLLTYAQLHARAVLLAGFLSSRGIVRGSRVAVMMRNRSEVIEAHFACAALRAILVNVNVNLAPPELQYILHDSNSELLIADSDFLAAIQQAATSGPPASIAPGTPHAAHSTPLPLLKLLLVVYPAAHRSTPVLPPAASAAAATTADGNSCFQTAVYHTDAVPELAPVGSPPRAVSAPSSSFAFGESGASELGVAAGAAGAAAGGAAEALAVHRAAMLGAGAALDPEDGYEMYYTSGTTGRPKGVILSHRIVMTHAIGTIREMQLHGGDVWGHFAPMFHLVDVFAIYAITLVGGRHVLQPTFSAVSTLLAIERERVSCSNVASTMVTLMVNSPLLPALDLTSLRILSCGGSPLAPAVVRRAVGALGCEFFVSYGMTECCGKISMSILPDRWWRSRVRVVAETTGSMEALGSAGVTTGASTGSEVRDLQDAGVTSSAVPGNSPASTSSSSCNVAVAPAVVLSAPIAGAAVELAAGGAGAVGRRDVTPGSGEVGEVWCKGPTVFSGYSKQGTTALDSSCLEAGGWFRTGDLAAVGSSGYIRVVDRMKDMILVGGENVYCTEVESVLYAHPAVSQAAVFGIPNQLMGETVLAAVVLKEAPAGQAVPAASAAATTRLLMAWCRERLANYKIPMRIHYLAAMPITGSGKVLKTELRRMFQPPALLATAAAPAAAPAGPNPAAASTTTTTTPTASDSAVMISAASAPSQTGRLVVGEPMGPGEVASMLEAAVSGLQRSQLGAMPADASAIQLVVVGPGSSLMQQALVALKSGVKAALLLTQSSPSPQELAALTPVSQAHPDADLRVVVLPPHVLRSVRLLRHALFTSSAGMACLRFESILLLPSAAASTVTVPPVTAAASLAPTASPASASGAAMEAIQQQQQQQSSSSSSSRMCCCHPHNRRQLGR
ncbi:MAG: hypothetical protein WDW38_007045 [Sanguina aurantia]